MHSYPYFTEGKVETQRELPPVSPHVTLSLGGKWLQDTALTGARWDPDALPARQQGTEAQSRKEVTWVSIHLSPHTPG